MTDVDHRLCGLALDECAYASFEKFAQAFHAAVIGTDFIPLGGFADGGADGFEDRVFHSSSRSTVFMQATKTPKIKQKIRSTLARLRQVGRQPNQVTFYFSFDISNIDLLEEELSEELSSAIRIRSKSYLIAHVNSSPATRAAYHSYIGGYTQYLSAIGSGTASRKYPFDERTLCAFLGQELESRRNNATLSTTVTDALILWALETTDPDQGLLLSRDEILGKVLTAVPGAASFIRGSLDARLKALSSKNNTQGRSISWHKKENLYALKYSERKLIYDGNIDDASLRSDFSNLAKSKFIEHFDGNPTLLEYSDRIVKALNSVIEELYLTQGLYISVRALSEEVSNTKIEAREIIERAIEEHASSPQESAVLGQWLSNYVQRLLYTPESREREYLSRLGRTYFLLFILRNEPSIVEYFNSMASDLKLVVGSDLLVRSLSEYLLPEELQQTTNALKIVRAAGSTLVLTEMAFEEVYTHLVAADLEFKNYYADIEPSISEENAIVIDRILIRSYFYAKLGITESQINLPGWRTFVGKFLDYAGLHTGTAKDGFRTYLCDRFSLTFEPELTTISSIDSSQIAALKEALLDERDRGRPQAEKRAENDATIYLRVKEMRLTGGEQMVANPFGYKSWWLTYERAVIRAAQSLYREAAPKIIMRPEFLINFIAISHTKKKIAESYRTVFPSSLGIELGRRIDQTDLHNILVAAQKAFEVDPSRARAMLVEYADKLRVG